MERPDPFQNRQNYEEIELTILDPNSEESAPPPIKEQEASPDAILSERETVAPQTSISIDLPTETKISPEVTIDNEGDMADPEPSDMAMEEPMVEPAVEPVIEMPEFVTQPPEIPQIESVHTSDCQPEPVAEALAQSPTGQIEMKDDSPVQTNPDVNPVDADQVQEAVQTPPAPEHVATMETVDPSATADLTPTADVGMVDDQEEAPSSSMTLEHRHKRPRRKQSAPSSSKKKSRSGAASAGNVKGVRFFTDDWEKCLVEFYRNSDWNGGSGTQSKWAELKSKTIERGEAWMHPPVNLPTRYLSEFLQLMYSENPDAAPEWKVLPSSLINVAAGTERRVQTHSCSHPLPFATPVVVNCRNENHVHYLLPLMLVAYTALKVIQNSIGVKRVVPAILKAVSLDVITQCPTFSTHLLLLGHDPVPGSLAISLACVHKWPKLEAAVRKHVVDESSRPARRKVLRAREEDLTDAEVSAIKDAVELCLQEIEDQKKMVREALMPKISPTTGVLPLNSMANFCKADKIYEAGDVVLRKVPCQILLTYSAALRLEVYKFLGLQPAMLEFEFDDLLQSNDSADVSDPDKILTTQAEKIDKMSCGAVWKELRKEHYRMLDQRIQIFMDFTLDRDQANWLMSESETARASRTPMPLSKASQMIANECLLASSSEAASGCEPNLTIDLNLDGVLKLPTGDKINSSSVEFGPQSDCLVNFVATRTIKGSDQLKFELGTQWRLVDLMYFSEE